MAEERVSKRARGEDGKEGEDEEGKQSTAGVLRDRLVTTLERHGPRLGADQKSASSSTSTVVLTLRLLPLDMFRKLLGFLTMHERMRTDQLSKLFRLPAKGKQDAQWSEKLLILMADQDTWFTVGKIDRLLPWLPVPGRLRKLEVVLGTGSTSARDILLNDPAQTVSVESLFVRDNNASPTALWPLAHTDLSAFPRLRRIHFVRSVYNLSFASFQSLYLDKFERRQKEAEAREGVDASDAIQPIQHCIIKMLLDLTTETSAIAFRTAPRFWHGLHEFGVSVMTLEEKWWQQLADACPNLTDIHMSVMYAFVMDDGTLKFIATHWPALNELRIYCTARASGTMQVTTVGISAFAAHDIHALSLKHDGRETASGLSSSWVEQADMLAKCLGAWPRLVTLELTHVCVPIHRGVLDAVGPLVKFMHVGVPSPLPPAAEHDAKTMTAFYKDHRHLADFPTWGLRSLQTMDSLAACAAAVGMPLAEWVETDPEQVLQETTAIALLESCRTLRVIGHTVSEMRDPFLVTALVGLRRPSNALRPLQTIDLRIHRSVHLSNESLQAVADVCPQLVTFKIALVRQDAEHLERSVTTATSQTMLCVLRRCPDLATLHLLVAPLAEAWEETDGLFTLTHSVRRVHCSVHFRVYLRPDASNEWIAWCRRHAQSLPLLPPRHTIRHVIVNLASTVFQV